MDIFKRRTKNRVQEIEDTDSPIKTSLINYFSLHNKHNKENLLTIAVSLGQVDLVRDLILRNKIDVDTLEKSDGKTPLLIGLKCYKICLGFLEDLNKESRPITRRLNLYSSICIEQSKDNASEDANEIKSDRVLSIVLDPKDEIPKISFKLGYSYNERRIVIKDYEECILYLISWDASPKSKDEARNTPLIIASDLGLSNIITAMLNSKNKCKLNHSNIYYETALHKAAINQHYEIVKALLTAGASSTGKTNNFYDGDTPLECIIRNVHKCSSKELTRSNRKEIIIEMIHKSKKHYSSTHEQFSLMSRAAKHGDTQTILILLDMNFPIHFESRYRETALGIALTNKQRKVTELLLQKGVDPNKRINGRRPINMAVKSQDIKNVKSLIQYGGKQDHLGIISQETMTKYQGILHLCLELGCIEIANLLYESGVCDIDDCYKLLEKTDDSQPYYAWLKANVHSPLSLRYLTRIKVLKSLRPFPYFRAAMDTMDVPEVLRSFLSFR